MLNFKNYLITFIALTFVICFVGDLSAKESEKNLGDPEFKNKVKIIKPDDVSLRTMRKMAVLINSTSPLFGEVAEDQLSIKLRDNGYDIIERSKISELTQRELMKEELNRLQEQLELEKQLDKAGEKTKELGILENKIDQLRRTWDTSQKEALNILAIGKKLGLDAVIMGTVFEGRRQIGFNQNNPPMSIEKLVVSTFHLQVIDVQTGKVALAIILEYDKGENITNAVDVMTKNIIENIKG